MYRQPCTEDSRLLLKEFRELYEVKSVEEPDREEPDRERSSAAIVEHRGALVTKLVRFKKAIDIANGLLQGTTKIARGSSKVSHEAARRAARGAC